MLCFIYKEIQLRDNYEQNVFSVYTAGIQICAGYE